MKKFISLLKKFSFVSVAVLSASLVMGGYSSQAVSADAPYTVEGNKVDQKTWVGSKIYERAFGRGCGTCHDVTPNPNLLESVKKLNRDQFAEVILNGRKAMPKAIDAMLAVGPVKKYNNKAGMTQDEAIDAIYYYLVGLSKGDIPAGKLKKIKK